MAGGSCYAICLSIAAIPALVAMAIPILPTMIINGRAFLHQCVRLLLDPEASRAVRKF